MTDCLFCKIVSGAIPATIVYQDEVVLAFQDIAPHAPTHLLVIPKQHVDSIAQVSDTQLLGQVFLAANKIAKQAGVDASGYRLVTNHGAHGGQTVGHWHVHLLAGRPLTWPPG